MPKERLATDVDIEDFRTNQCFSVDMQLHDILVVILVLERKGSETNDGLEIALNHKTAQT